MEVSEITQYQFTTRSEQDRSAATDIYHTHQEYDMKFSISLQPQILNFRPGNVARLNGSALSSTEFGLRRILSEQAENGEQGEKVWFAVTWSRNTQTAILWGASPVGSLVDPSGGSGCSWTGPAVCKRCTSM